MSQASTFPKQKTVFGDSIATCSIPVLPAPGSTVPPNARARLIDFSKSPLPLSYPGYYALVIDNVFTPEECQALIQGATNSTNPPGQWVPAEVNIGGGQQSLLMDIRNSGRILWDDQKAADYLLDRVRPFLDEHVQLLGGKGAKWKPVLYHQQRPAIDHLGRKKITSDAEFVQDKWQMTRVNERLRFLKYGPGEFFERHRDGSFSTLQIRPDEPEERSYLTIQAYLSSSEDLVGGETTFYPQWGHATEADNEIPIEPIPGRVLIFQHRHLVHSGGKVLQGEKIVVRSDIMYKHVE